MAQQQHDPQRKNEPRREERFPGAEDRPDAVRAPEQNREGGGRSRDQGRRGQQPPERDRQETREQGQGRSGRGDRRDERERQGGER